MSKLVPSLTVSPIFLPRPVCESSCFYPGITESPGMIKTKSIYKEHLRNNYRNGKFSDVLLCTDSLSKRET